MADCAAVVDLVRPWLAHARRERVVVVVCDTALRVRRAFVLTEGSSDECLLPVRELLTGVLLHDGSSFAVAHNHPSGDVTPSDADLAVTASLAAAAAAVGLEFLTHVVVGAGRLEPRARRRRRGRPSRLRRLARHGSTGAARGGGRRRSAGGSGRRGAGGARRRRSAAAAGPRRRSATRLRDGCWRRCGRTTRCAPADVDDLALVVPTSGSTGEPKGALLTRAAVPRVRGGDGGAVVGARRLGPRASRRRTWPA